MYVNEQLEYFELNTTSEYLKKTQVSKFKKFKERLRWMLTRVYSLAEVEMHI